MEREEVMKAIRQRLDAIEPNTKAYLFGSRARGDARDDEDPDKRSDWDVLILLDKQARTSWDDFDKFSVPLDELGMNLNEVINPVVRTVKDWEENDFSLFNHNVKADAIAI